MTKNRKKELTVRIVGSGLVGMAVGKGFLARGISVSFVDIDQDKVLTLKKEGFRTYTSEELRSGKVEGDFSFITVPTPNTKNGINLDFIRAAAEDIGSDLKKTKNYHTVVVKSTVPPGTTEEVVAKTIEKISGKKAGSDFGLCMNPEYLRRRHAEKDFNNPRIIVIGEYDRRSGNSVKRLYEDFNAPIKRVPIKSAEMQKYVHNIYNATKISFFNEMRGVCKDIGIDAEEVFLLVTKSAEGIWNREYGIWDYGAFAGNTCLPKDTAGFLAWAKEKGIDMKILKAVLKINKKLKPTPR